MKLTEFLVMGYDGDEAVFACNLTPGTVRTIFTATDPDGHTAVESNTERTAPAFASLCQALEDALGTEIYNCR